MKNKKSLFKLLLVILIAFTLTGCDLLEDLLGDTGSKDSTDEFDEELTSSTGKWQLLEDEDTYFIFDGAKNVMSYSYYEDGIKKYQGSYRVVHRGTGNKILTPLTFIFTRSDKEKEDWVGCYVEDFEESFTQFTIMQEEEDLGMIDATIYTHIYRISELPYKMGTYILEGNEYKKESDNYAAANRAHIPTGTYALDSGESFVFLTIKPRHQELFQYRNGDILIEGTYTLAEDRKTIYLYIEHDPYSKVTNADKEKYDTTFSLYYPPDFYLRGNFSNPDSFVIDALYHHTQSPTKIEDSSWVFGTYKKAN